MKLYDVLPLVSVLQVDQKYINRQSIFLAIFFSKMIAVKYFV